MSLPREGARVTRDGILMSVPMNWGRSPQAIVPYRIHTQGQIEGAQAAGSVRQTDQASYVEGSLIKACYGDEAATGGGVQFGTQGAECEPKTWSKTVKIQDKGVVRHDDEWWMNHKETWGKLTYPKDTNTYDTPKAKTVEPRTRFAFYQTPNTTTDFSPFTVPSAPPETAPAPQPQPLEIPALGRDGIALRVVTGAIEAAGMATSALAAAFLLAMTSPAGEPEKDGFRTTGKPRGKCPCKVGKYKDLKNICAHLCENGQAHHIVPDFTKRYVARKYARGEAGRIKGLASYDDGASICLQGNAKDDGSEHFEAHGADSEIEKLGNHPDTLLMPKGTAFIEDIRDKSTRQVIKLREDCAEQISAVVSSEFSGINPNTLGRTTIDRLPTGTALRALSDQRTSHAVH
ncbi:protein of unknown function [Methylobacterium sp. UNC378MF]|uniref:DUF4150 domain-containing protein n=1 Tax=Methylobacterium sp. UNC378MF TaxID=1502748 RepID=UPI00088BFC24|nr:DUF4150 domain-containing protein [Methylobacterium sp. UNC378MF]SDA32875.1 protein of unknown function [Methylobacterium sp. UNC378MF]